MSKIDSNKNTTNNNYSRINDNQTRLAAEIGSIFCIFLSLTR